MSLLVVGSIGYDTVITPASSGKDLLGGSATYCSIAASNFTHVFLVGVVGNDFKREHLNLFQNRDINITGLEIDPSDKTFRWSGRYFDKTMNTRETLSTELNVLTNFKPKLTAEHKQMDFVFLGNMTPDIQVDTLEQLSIKPKVIGLDTMDFWIESSKSQLTKAINMVDVVFMNEEEILLYSKNDNLVDSARSIINLGPWAVFAKRGEKGSMLITKNSVFAAPVFPVKTVADTTGAGDCFAGGVMGYLSAKNTISLDALEKATIVGSVMGSFAVETFSIEGLQNASPEKVSNRINHLLATRS
jgi:sugar/nucleoside kinase (ribokinase family)